jgi:hypothetical protein
MSATDLIAIFGLLEPRPAKPPDSVVRECYTLDSFKVEVFTDAVRLTCKCCRSNPYLLDPSDLRKIHPASGLYACSTCLSELKTAKTPSDKIAVWFAQNTASITKENHLHLPKEFCRLVDTDKKTIMRPRRFVYAKFFKTELKRSDKILSTCGDPLCVNPYHMMLAASPAAKVTPEMKKDVYKWTVNNVHPRTMKQMLEIKYKCSLSLKTITNLKKSMLASGFTQS